MYRNFFLPIVVALSHNAFAETPAKTKKPPLDPNKVFRISYSQPSWNKDSTVIDSGTIYIKDSQSGRIVQFILTEDAPDAGVFSGVYKLNFGTNAEINPEVYIPSKKEQTISKSDLSSFQNQIGSGKITRKPFVMRKGSFNEQVVEVFNTKEETVAALKKYKEESDKNLDKAKPNVPEKVDKLVKSVLDAEQLAKLEAEKKARHKEEEARNTQRLSLSEQARKKIDALKKEFAGLSPAEKQKRRKLAKDYAEAALDFYRANQFPQAEENFRKSFELDPENTSYFYRYGITLFRNEKFNEAIVFLSLSEGKDVDPIEKKFYLGLCHFRLKEEKNALGYFQEVKNTKHEQLAPSASFYEGMVHYEALRYENATTSFQDVLDTSKDPRLDEKAEEMIELIQKAIQFAKNRDKTILLTGTLGLQYDSNILLDPTQSDQGTPANGGDTRYVFGGSAEWRPIYTAVQEWSLIGKADYTRSNLAKFASADPLMYTLRAPYKRKTQLWGKGYKLELSPGYEMLYLDETPVDNNVINYMNSITLDWLNTFIMNEDWILNGGLKIRNDSVLSASATGDSNSSANKVSLTWNNIFFTDKKKTTGWTADLNAHLNMSTGKNYRYRRFDIGGGYIYPGPWESQGSVSLLYYNASYSDISRTDSNYTLSATLSKGLNEWLTGVLLGNYVSNGSTVTSNDYKKYLIGLLLVANYGF